MADQIVGWVAIFKSAYCFLVKTEPISTCLTFNKQLQAFKQVLRLQQSSFFYFIDLYDHFLLIKSLSWPKCRLNSLPCIVFFKLGRLSGSWYQFFLKNQATVTSKTKSSTKFL